MHIFNTFLNVIFFEIHNPLFFYNETSELARTRTRDLALEARIHDRQHDIYKKTPLKRRTLLEMCELFLKRRTYIRKQFYKNVRTFSNIIEFLLNLWTKIEKMNIFLEICTICFKRWHFLKFLDNFLKCEYLYIFNKILKNKHFFWNCEQHFKARASFLKREK